jgi:hypothetical protein
MITALPANCGRDLADMFDSPQCSINRWRFSAACAYDDVGKRDGKP